MFLVQKYTQYKAAQAEQQKRKVTEKELAQLNHKIEKLLSKLDEHEPEIAEDQDEECVVCVNAKATMQTYPCGHRVVCRKCFVKTIQMAVAQRLLPLRCVLCRAKILRLKHSNASTLPSSASQYTIGSQWYHVPQSESLYSVSSAVSGVSGISGMSGVSSASSCSSASSYKTCASSFSSSSLKRRHYAKQGYQPLRTSSSPSGSPSRKCSSSSASSYSSSRHEAKPKKRDKDTTTQPNVTTPDPPQPPKGKLSLIQEFQREFRNGKSKAENERKGSAGSHKGGSGSTRIKCAKILVNQASQERGTPNKLDHAKSSTSLSKPAVGFRRIGPPPTSQSCHSFRLSRHDAVAPASSSFFRRGRSSLQTIPESGSKPNILLT